MQSENQQQAMNLIALLCLMYHLSQLTLRPSPTSSRTSMQFVITEHRGLTMLRVIDTETTGLEGGPETVVEIASVDIVDGVICNPMSDLVKPGVAIGFEAMAIHHITEDMVEGAPLLSEVIGTIWVLMPTSPTTRIRQIQVTAD